ncbi:MULTISPECIES: TetR/AcrR family transcriptional regulator [Mycolicibacterium]|uniref:Transcriptional regulator, TetR family n=1 Tax=Mycolicibacterium senegalense TaxID=1796 RepID=A0A378W7D2_9MYCO|nr:MULTISPECIES: TetR/AcrR family transcriptional regulator [Mycolicibacterium]MCV7336955.1 TetR/AcrR family transcriptional regulator [Mycolicibacterium senegalense]MDR7287537.1 AcrR family transcriptional regulator [Mycolicibacterium senegalense]QZA24583.1 TetR/AcrR family transcriptional regulator [Mycolicibacterium senegalense]CDP87228.1 TetR family transcriptional regulator [Mycolicibacterium farcinogenes]SUA28886.1 Transcriptional regulator, TetR family [Mycolicibacterium senegalense]
MEGSVFALQPAPIQLSNADRIRDAALRCFATGGISGTTMRTIAEAAGVSHGLLRHHFGSKDGLIAAVDDHVLRVFSDALESNPLPVPAEPTNDFSSLGGRMSKLIHDRPEVVDYVSHALIEGNDIGAVIFDGLLKISIRQRDTFTAAGLTRDDIDPDWAALNPLMLRLGPILLRSHIARHIDGAFTTPAELQRWDASVTALIRHGQFTADPAQHT